MATNSNTPYNSYTIDEFLSLTYDQFYSNLSNKFLDDHNEEAGTQKDAWKYEFEHLSKVLDEMSGRVIFEYRISGFQKVIDVVVLYHGKIYVLEYKCGSAEYSATDVRQANGYALRLKYFHSKSNENWIIPILIATDAPSQEFHIKKSEEDNVCRPILCNSENLRRSIDAIDNAIPYSGSNEWENDWEKGVYKASPTIIEAACNVWKKNNVSGFQGDSDDSIGTAQRLQSEDYIVKTVVPETKARKGKSICFVTGVPGAGKTLVGLNISVLLQNEGASLLSGNGPLVSVLSTALKRDLRINKNNLCSEKNEISVESIIRGAYEYKKEIFDKRLIFNTEDGTITRKSGSEHSSQHVIIFDEAQRAWTQTKLIKPGQAGKKYWQEKNFPFSEPALLLWDMNNIPDWGVFVCLVGGGQEIHDGEAGICEWLSALKNREELKDWHIYIADAFQGKEYDSTDGSGETIISYRKYFDEQNRLHTDDSLHLTECQRSIRSSKVSDLINSILNCDTDKAKSLYQEVKGKFHIHITRDVDIAKQTLRKRKAEHDGLECRIGMLMSSSAARLRPLGYPSGIKTKVDHWFLDDDNNVDSSNFLEVALDEFSVQGLELDMTAVMWDADMRYRKETNSWSFHKFNNGRDWSEIVDDPGPKTKVETEANRRERERKNRNRQINRSYMLNAYRVLLTRGRTDMVIVIPKGDISDPSRKEEYYDSTYNYLLSLGLTELK